jgi:hypothetical protein
VYSMLTQYVELQEPIKSLDHDSIAELELQPLLLTRRQDVDAAVLLVELNGLQGVTKELQRPTLTLSGARRLFDAVEKFPSMRDRIGENADIVNYPALESGLAKLQRGGRLMAAERDACAAF